MRRITALAVAAMLAFYGLGDFATTTILFARPDLVETNPFARWAYHHAGLAGIAARKVVGTGLALGTFPLAKRMAATDRLQVLAKRYDSCRYLPAYVDWMPTIVVGVFAVLGVVATVNNLLLIV